ncbi:hypothetical protein ACEZCY_17130 [Streptacidiphilus sp. N1-12]|uniref:Uncharacterized protein n=2 Tax=Streptacidiphilus alkalitolerans TaxID=3342712 RepID=A0ABV6WFX7_9ACTN
MSRFSEDQDIESELVAAMNDFTDSTPVPAYDPAALIAARRRRRPQLWALAAAVVAVAAVGTGVALATGGDSPTPLPPASPSVSAASHAPSPSASATPSTVPPGAANIDPMTAQMDALRTVTVAAEMYENPATRGQVKLDAVAARFTSPAAFTKAWGNGGLGVTCGQVANGALGGGADLLLFKGTHQLSRMPQFGYDPESTKLTGVTCVDAGRQYGDPVLTGVYGKLVSGAQPAKGMIGPKVPSATCGRNPARTWYADDPGSGTLVEGWKLRLDGYGPIDVGIDPNKGPGQVFSVTCPK